MSTFTPGLTDKREILDESLSITGKYQRKTGMKGLSDSGFFSGVCVKVNRRRRSAH